MALINTMTPGKFEWNFRYVIFKPILVSLIDSWGISCEIANVDPDLCCHMASLGHNELNLVSISWWLGVWWQQTIT